MPLNEIGDGGIEAGDDDQRVEFPVPNESCNIRDQFRVSIFDVKDHLDALFTTPFDSLLQRRNRVVDSFYGTQLTAQQFAGVAFGNFEIVIGDATRVLVVDENSYPVR